MTLTNLRAKLDAAHERIHVLQHRITKLERA